jgi:hypothetical protein
MGDATPGKDGGRKRRKHSGSGLSTPRALERTRSVAGFVDDSVDGYGQGPRALHE